MKRLQVAMLACLSLASVHAQQRRQPQQQQQPQGEPATAPAPTATPANVPEHATATPPSPTAPSPVPGSPPAAPSSSQERQFPAPPAIEKFSRTEHTLNIRGAQVPYTATAGTLVIRQDGVKPLASMFFVAYTRNDKPDKSSWPITYSFNGGPGSSSVWLHMGALGPRKVQMGANGEQPAPPYHLVDNDNTVLTFTDIVFIDPVTTGFSRQAPGENPQQFHGFDGDLESVSEFIRQWTTKFDRWASPKFLAGESYGTTRSAGLSEYLLDNHGIYLNGITLISTVLNFETIDFVSGNDLPYTMYLPSYAATSWYHKKLSPDLQGQSIEKVVEEARRFAGNEYTVALMKGDKLSAAERTTIAKQYARFTGLSQAYVERANLRVRIERFTKELLRDQAKTVGRYDSRIQGSDIDAAGDRPEYDPSYAAVQGVFTAMFNSYIHGELKWETDVPYEVLTGRVQPWSYSRFQNRFVNTAEMLRSAMNQEPNLKVLAANGYYDLATPFFATEYTLSHLNLESPINQNIRLTYCEAGHMLYTNKACLDKLHQSMTEFYSQATNGVSR